MSDTFDHMCDAYDQAVNMGEGLELYDNTGDNQYKSYNSFGRISNPLYYHNQYFFKEIKIETKGENGAYLFENNKGARYWVPKKLCRALDKELGSVWIWNKFKPKRLKKENYNERK